MEKPYRLQWPSSSPSGKRILLCKLSNGMSLIRQTMVSALMGLSLQMLV